MKTVKFSDYIKTVTPKTKIQAKKFLESGAYPIVSQEAGAVNGYWNDSKDVMHFDKPVVVFGDHTRAVKFIDFDFVAGADGTKILLPSDDLESRYFYHWLNAHPVEYLGYARHFRLLKDMDMVIPSLNEQRRIVARLDAAFEKIDRAIELAERNIKNSDLLFGGLLSSAIDTSIDVQRRMLGDIASIEYGLTEKAKPKGDLRFVRITDINNDGFLKSDGSMYVDRTANAARYSLKDGDLLVARTGATFGKVLYFNNKIPSVFASYLIRVNFNVNIHPKLFWYYAKTPQYWEQANKVAGGAAQPQFNGNALKKN